MYAIRSYYEFGRKKIQSLLKGLKAIEEGRLTITDLIIQMGEIESCERLYGLLLQHVKDRIRNFYSRYRITSYNVCYTKLLRFSGSWLDCESNRPTHAARAGTQKHLDRSP